MQYMQVLPSCPSYEVCPKTKELGNTHNACRVFNVEEHRNAYPSELYKVTYDRVGKSYLPESAVPLEIVHCTTCNKYFIKSCKVGTITWEIDT